MSNNSTPIRCSSRLVKAPDASKKVSDIIEPTLEVPKKELENFYSIRFENTNYSPYISCRNVTDETSFMKFLINLRNSKKIEETDKKKTLNWAYDDISGFLDGAVRGYEDGFEVNYEHNKNLNPWARMAKILETGAFYE
jgi:hypothetical protein